MFTKHILYKFDDNFPTYSIVSCSVEDLHRLLETVNLNEFSCVKLPDTLMGRRGT